MAAVAGRTAPMRRAAVGHWTVHPPSTARHSPVTNEAASLARKTAGPAISSGSANRANVVQDAIDTAVQICGGNGIGKDLSLADFYENVRQLRIVDGADEVHKRVIARRAFEDVNGDEVEHLTRYDGE